jgi:hypothetical protein
MEDLEELVRKYNLEEDIEHIIIPLPDPNGRMRRCFLLKRRFLRIQFPDGNFSDFPIGEIIEATVKYPELLLSESIHYVHKTPEPSLVAGDEDK